MPHPKRRTERFHAKFYLFDDTAMVGSANLTYNGLIANREGVVCLDRQADAEAITELKALFAELWEGADVLTRDIVETSEGSLGSKRPMNGAIDTQVGTRPTASRCGG